MGVAVWVWAITLVGLVGMLLFDVLVITRRPHAPTLRESTAWVVGYVLLALAFGLGVWYFKSATFAGQFYAGWITEYSLSIDNLFVFIIIMSRFAVPRQLQQKTLLIGILLALVLRAAFIAAGVALISRYDWIFFIFGAFLLYTSTRLVRHGTEDPVDYRENAATRFARRWLRTTSEYDERGRLSIRMASGRRMFTPLLIVIIALGTADLVFALDSLPAIFGLTTEAYLVLTANVFAVMGLRQLYFLLGDLLDRLKYLSYGLAIVLAFIGIKLILGALHGNNLSFVNGGRPVAWAPEIPIYVSLLVIGVTIAVTTIASLASTRRDRPATVP
ncbi:MAG TPA: TerC family protein [Micromonosporaceae bacterium]|jgi:tellurite resistance protein TerC